MPSSRPITRLLASALTAGVLAVPAVADSSVVDVIIVAGQSNAVGAGRPSDVSDSMQPFIAPRDDIRYCFWVNGETWTTSWVDLAPRGGYTFGVEMMLGHVLERAAPDRTLAIMKVAYNGTSLACAWNPQRSPGGNDGPCNSSLYLFSHLKDWMNQWRHRIQSEGGTCRFAGLVWVQGESDMLSGWMPPLYEGLMDQFITELRDHAGNPDMPVVMAMVNPRAGAYAFQEPVQSAMLRLAHLDERTATVTCADLPLKSDDVHFTADSMVWLGGRLGDALLAMKPFRTSSPEEPPEEPPTDTCRGDVTGNGVVDSTDLLEIIAAWGPCP